MQITQEFLTRLKGFEGTFPWMYSDTRGNVTVGCGHMITTPANASLLGFDCGPEIAKSDWAIIKSARSGKLAQWYGELTHSRLSAVQADELLTKDIEISRQALLRNLPELGSFPQSAQEALMDMAFNMGSGFVFRFPRLIGAVRSGKWQTAALECTRNGVQPARNSKTSELFALATIADVVTVNPANSVT